MPTGPSVVLPEQDSVAHVAAAVCFALAVDPAALDPDEELRTQFWPWAHLDFDPRPDRLDNLQMAQAHLARAAELTRTESAPEGAER